MSKSEKKLQELLQYAQQGWKIFPVKPNAKSPLTKHGHNDASNDPKQIKKWDAQYPDANWGLATGKMSGCFVVDVDVKNDKPGIDNWKLLKKVCPIYPTFASKTPSGGKHYYYQYPSEVEVASANGMMEGIDIKADGGYVLIPPSEIDGNSYIWRDADVEILEAPENLLQVLKHGKKIAPPLGIKEGQRNDAIFKYACKLQTQKVTYTLAEKLVLAVAINCKPKFPESEARKCLESAYSGKYDNTASDTVNEENIVEIVAEINKNYAVVMFGGKCVILKETQNPILQRRELSFLSIADFRNYFANKRETIHDKEVSWGKIWFEHTYRRQYEGLVFSPCGNFDNHYNLWTGYGCEARKGDCSLYLKHIENVICSGDEELYEYVIAWMADAVQNPSDRPGTALVLRGSQGTGKGMFAKYFGSLFGQHFLHITHAKHLTGHFNAHLMSTCLIFADEAVWGGNKSEEGVLKALVTEETMAIESKGKDVINLTNHARLIIASNNRWIVPAGLEERRFVVIDVSARKMQNHKYFGAMCNQMENGGREALLHYLQNYDLKSLGKDFLREIPLTDALIEMKHYSMSPVQKFWFDKLEAGSIKETDDCWPEVVPLGDLYEEFCKHSNRAGTRTRGALTQFGMEMRYLLPRLKITKPQLSVGGVKKQVKCYELPSLDECREHFDMIMHTENKWEEECAITTTDNEN